MSQVISQSVIATPARNENAAFSIIAQTRHINLFDEDDKTKNRDVVEMDVHVHVEPRVSPRLKW